MESPLVQEFTVEPGSSHTGSVTLLNLSDQPASVIVYVNDFFQSSPGEASFSDPRGSTHGRSNASWLGITEPIVQLQPLERRTVNVSIQVPTSPGSPRGTYWSAVMVESMESYRRRTSPTAAGSAARYSMTMTTSYRTAIIFATTMPDSESKSISFLGVSTRPTTDGHLLQVDLRNNGTTAIRGGRSWVEVYDVEGRKRAEIELDPFQILLPGNTYRRDVQLAGDQLGRGFYRTLVVVDAGPDAMFGTQATIRLAPSP